MEKHFLPEIMKELPRLKAWAERLVCAPLGAKFYRARI